MENGLITNAVDNAVDGAAAKDPSTGRFQKGNPGFRLRRRAQEREEADQEVPPLLKAMRWVTTREESKDRTQLQREARRWLAEDRKGFMMKMADLEKALLASQKAAKATV